MTLALTRFALSISVVAAVLAGCGGNSSTAGISAAIPETSALEHSSGAKTPKVNGGYLYVSDLTTATLYLYRYDPKTMTLTSAGGLSGFQAPYGSCSDKNGNVYVTDFLALTITEFAFGTLKAIKTLSEDAGDPEGCSVDPTTGNLAVTNFGGPYFVNGSVLIYKNASGTPRQYNGALQDWTAGYDPNGNLWVEGANASKDGYVMELPKGGSFLKSVTFDRPLYLPAAAQWDGEYLDIGEQEYEGKFQAALYQTKIFRGRLRTVNTILPSSTCYAGVGFQNWAWIGASSDDLPKTQATQIAAGNQLCNFQYDIWTYPSGGMAAAELKGPEYPTGQTYVTKPTAFRAETSRKH